MGDIMTLETIPLACFEDFVIVATLPSSYGDPSKIAVFLVLNVTRVDGVCDQVRPRAGLRPPPWLKSVTMLLVYWVQVINSPEA